MNSNDRPPTIITSGRTPKLPRCPLGYQHPEEVEPEGPQFRTWDRAFRYLDEVIGDEHTIVIFDEFPFAVGADPALPSHLQVAWDHLLKDKALTLVLAGSPTGRISMMEDLRQHDAPLYGRFTAELPIGPTPFSAVKELFPGRNAVQRVSVYATLGGVPFYLQQCNHNMSVSENIRSHLFRHAGFFRNEPRNIITELGLEQPQYEEIITAIALGAHRFTDIPDTTNIGGNNLPPLLNTLIDLHLIERPFLQPSHLTSATGRGVHDTTSVIPSCAFTTGSSRSTQN